jgi:hypothetical protein
MPRRGPSITTDNPALSVVIFQGSDWEYFGSKACSQQPFEATDLGASKPVLPNA